MKILLDECIDIKLQRYLPNYEVHTVTGMGWNSVKNGKLLEKCVENGFDILVSVDKKLQYQQNLDKYPLAIVVFNSPSNRIKDLVTFIHAFTRDISTFEKHKAYLIENV